MQTKDKPVTLIYKGSITQSTGEDWDDVPLTLETATPTFGVGVPTLTPWTLSLIRPVSFKFKSHGGMRGSSALTGSMAMPSLAPPPLPGYAMDVSTLMSSEMDEIQHRGLQVSSKGNISATFGVPGLINIPSDGVGHSVTIAKLELDATMSWVCVPKKDGKVHLKVSMFGTLEDIYISAKRRLLVDRQRLRMPLSTPSSQETPVYMSMGVSSPSQMYPLSAQTRVSTALSGMFSVNPL
jgi:hypothetical protein